MLDFDATVIALVCLCVVVLGVALVLEVQTTARLRKLLDETRAQHVQTLARLQLLHNAQRDAQGERR